MLIKRATNPGSADAAAAFFNIHLHGLRGYPIEAIRETMSHFIYRDHREPENKPFFPLPDELIDVIQQETRSLEWRLTQKEREAEHAKRQAEELTRIGNSPYQEPKEVKTVYQEICENIDFDKLSQQQITELSKLIRSEKTKSPAQIIAEFKERSFA